MANGAGKPVPIKTAFPLYQSVGTTGPVQLEPIWLGTGTGADDHLQHAGTAVHGRHPFHGAWPDGAIAAIGRPTAVRAVGAANGRNPVCIVVPCHRVVGSDGSLTGYAGGVERKQLLLALERG